MKSTPLLDRVRAAIGRRAEISERRMFGGVCFMAGGHMIGGVTGDGELIIRVGPAKYEDSLTHPHVRLMDFTGRPMRGFVVVEPPGCAADDALLFWLERGLSHARSLPPKTAATRKTAKSPPKGARRSKSA